MSDLDPYYADKKRLKSFRKYHYRNELRKKGCGIYDDYRAFKNGIPDGYKDVIQYAEITEQQKIVVVIVECLCCIQNCFVLILIHVHSIHQQLNNLLKK